MNYFLNVRRQPFRTIKGTTCEGFYENWARAKIAGEAWQRSFMVITVIGRGLVAEWSRNGRGTIDRT